LNDTKYEEALEEISEFKYGHEDTELQDLPLPPHRLNFY